MRTQVTGRIWMLSPGTLRALVKEALEELNTRITDYSLAIDVKQFEAACACIDRSSQALKRRMEGGIPGRD